MKRRFLLSTIPLGLLAVGLSSASCSETTCVDSATCSAPQTMDAGEGGGDATISPDAATDGAADQAVDQVVITPDGQTCDLSKSPREQPCEVQEAFSIFAAPSGSDTAPGTRLAPVATIGQALKLAKAAHKRVIACSGVFDEKVVIDATTDGVGLFGGFGCPAGDAGTDAGDAQADGGSATAWTYGGAPAKVAPSTTGYPLRIDSTVALVVVEDFELDAHDGVADSESSVAVFANHAAAVTLRRVRAVAGKGAPRGKDAADQVGTPATTAGGSLPTGKIGGAGGACVCPNGGSTKGGQGGAGDPANATDGLPGSAVPVLVGTSPNDGAGGAAGCMGGDNGGAVSVAAAGGNGATTMGKLDPSGWTPMAGGSGAGGLPGQGGGGQGGGSSVGGGGGGCGGCGGAGGSGGFGGGASIALASLASAITLDACTLIANDAGPGGKGGGGQAGGLGGAGRPGAGAGCGTIGPGGTGGAGGPGGAGGGGIGGSSVAIVFTDPQPVETNATSKQVGAFGAGGAAGTGGVPPATSGSVGVAQPTLKSN